MAAVIGRSVKSPSYKIGTTTKTLAGSITMLIITFIIISGFLVYSNISFWFFKSILISAVVTLIEALSIKGTDNLTVPLSTAAILFLL